MTKNIQMICKNILRDWFCLMIWIWMNIAYATVSQEKELYNRSPKIFEEIRYKKDVFSLLHKRTNDV